MSNAADGGGGGGNVGFDVSRASLTTAIRKLDQVSGRIARLESDFAGFTGQVSSHDWSTEAACASFGASYTSALEVYTQVLAGMKSDLAYYVDQLREVKKGYDDADDRSEQALRRLGAYDGAPMQQDTRGRAAYDDPTRHGHLDSDRPDQAPDRTPDAPGVNGTPAPTGADQATGAAEPTGAAGPAGADAGPPSPTSSGSRTTGMS